MDRRMNPEQKRSWIDVRIFERDGVAVRVTKLDAPGRPRYSMDLGRMVEPKTEGPKFFSSHIPVMSEGTGKIVLSNTFSTSVLAELIFDAREYVLVLLQQAEDSWIDRQTNNANTRNRRDQPAGLKTLSKQDCSRKGWEWDPKKGRATNPQPRQQ